MKKSNKRFAFRLSEFPMQILMGYLSQKSPGQGIVLELSRVGCRIRGNEPVVAGETLSVQFFLPNSPKPLLIEQAVVKWAKGWEFGLAFKRLQPQEADQLQHLLDELLGGSPYSGVPARQHTLRA